MTKKKSKTKSPQPNLEVISGFGAENHLTGYSNILSPADPMLTRHTGRSGFDIYDEIARDGRVSSALTKRKQKLVGREWKIKPASDAPRDLEAADFVRTTFENIPFDQIVLDLLDATLKGFAVSEVIWKFEDGKVTIDRINSLEQSRFVFDKEQNLRLLKTAFDVSGEIMPDQKFIVHRYRAKAHNPYGLGLGYELFWPSQFKRRGVGFWQKFLDRWSAPIPVGKVVQGTTKEDRSKLLNHLLSLNNAKAFVMNLGEELDSFETSRSGRAEFEAWVKTWNEEITIIINGETLTTSLDGQGSRAAGEVHSDMLDDLVDFDADLISGTFNSTVIKWLCDFNFTDVGYPKIWWELPADEHEQEKLLKARAERRRLDLDVFEKTRELGYEPTDPEWLSNSQGVELRPIAESKKKDNPAFVAGSVVEFTSSDIVVTLSDYLSESSSAYFQAIIESMKDDVARADNFDDFTSSLQAGYTLDDDYTNKLGQAFILAHCYGRSEIIDESSETDEFAQTQFPGGPFEEQLEFFRQKISLPSNDWTDIMRNGHDRAFVVAGANRMEIVEDLRAAVDDAIENGTTFRDFQKNFDEVADKHSWDYNGDREWRARTIYETNLRTSHMAGRLSQMRDPDITERRPYWQYVHGQTRKPKIARREHKSWDGLILRYDDPWWDTHYPPNGWKCSCGVITLSQNDLERLGYNGPDTAPDLGDREMTIWQTGEKVRVPNGVGLGWDHAPGATWENGLVPKHLATPLSLPANTIAHAQKLTETAKPFSSDVLAAGQADEEYARAFLQPFGADIGKGVVFRDKAEQVIVISDALLRDGSGRLKVNKFDRGRYMPILAETIIDPDEIWINWQRDKISGRDRLVRNYLRAAPDDAGFAVFSYRDGLFWYGNTTFAPRKRSKVDLRYIENRRQGALLYQRKK